ALLGAAKAWDAWAPLLAGRFCRRGAYFIPRGEFDWEGDDSEAWRPGDALLVPLTHSEEQLLGILSVNEPQSLRRPSDEQLDVLVAVAEYAAVALHAAQEQASTVRDRAALEELLHASSLLAEPRAVGSLLQSVCDAIRSALGFETVTVEL